jgi:hypothetical protein
MVEKVRVLDKSASIALEDIPALLVQNVRLKKATPNGVHLMAARGVSTLSVEHESALFSGEHCKAIRTFFDWAQRFNREQIYTENITESEYPDFTLPALKQFLGVINSHGELWERIEGGSIASVKELLDLAGRLIVICAKSIEIINHFIAEPGNTIVSQIVLPCAVEMQILKEKAKDEYAQAQRISADMQTLRNFIVNTAVPKIRTMIDVYDKMDILKYSKQFKWDTKDYALGFIPIRTRHHSESYSWSFHKGKLFERHLAGRLNDLSNSNRNTAKALGDAIAQFCTNNIQVLARYFREYRLSPGTIDNLYNGVQNIETIWGAVNMNLNDLCGTMSGLRDKDMALILRNRLTQIQTSWRNVTQASEMIQRALTA